LADFLGGLWVSFLAVTAIAIVRMLPIPSVVAPGGRKIVRRFLKR